ncbi:MAG TPA: phosphoribosylformylglycinamidine synthase [Peptococcaceae bacterium]|nr:phosphoribosylformylglycinamidine synthase [Peptococcaceae bacterium]HPZ71199.1 phosphoribosylformylglycinamidine synthase [Peptococcaceae bacterium]HQD53781.1 phosphoribosylformylglycinamidine synthase [Peptococcaceae bacterium]
MSDPNVLRIFVEKKPGFDIEAQKLFNDLKMMLNLDGLTGLRILNRYDVEGISPAEFEAARQTIFAEPTVDWIYLEEVSFGPNDHVLPIEYLPGQYDQRADSAAQCIQILTRGELPLVRTAKLLVLQGELSPEELRRIRDYCINPIETRKASLEKPTTLQTQMEVPQDVEILTGFINLSENGLQDLIDKLGLAMSPADLAFCQDYFKNNEKRDPTITEIRVIDTYWSDHCRHTTFHTVLKEVSFAEGPFAELMQRIYQNYVTNRPAVTKPGQEKEITLMDLATVAMRHLKKDGYLDDLEVSDEINASSIVVKVNTEKGPEDWLVMFKNETHNHPTEIEPFGGAATCLGGAIRDPLSGRAFVYQAMRVSGSGDPRARIEETLPGKLPQKKITTGAAAGYSSYGNQVGLATGQVAEVYHPNFVAKRMEVGAVIGAAPQKNVKREKPVPGDVIILVGGRTGRDGCGGATGSSKEHTEESLVTCCSEVQKGNAPTERKIQRLFRNPEVSLMIKKCNDFGAGGVSVAIGELADGLEVNLDKVPKKYEGLDGTELAISESQERMAVVVSAADEAEFIRRAREENLEATTVATVSAENRVKLYWRGKAIVDLSREFLNSNGAKQYATARVLAPQKEASYFRTLPADINEADLAHNLTKTWLDNLTNLNHCSQRGLIEMFDSTIGAGTVLMPLGGAYQLSPQEGMAAKIPVPDGETTTGTLMAYGYNPEIGMWSPFHGAVFAIVESCAKIACMGGDYRKIRFSFQEYFEKLGHNPEKWGKPLAALLGAYHTQLQLKLPSIGGKDSMSGTFKDLSVPPTLISFAVNVVEDVRKVISTEFKAANNPVVLLSLPFDENELPDFEQLKKNYTALYELIQSGKILAARSIRSGGIAAAVSEMALGNMVGFAFDPAFLGSSQESALPNAHLFAPLYGSILLEIAPGQDVTRLLAGLPYQVMGHTQEKAEITLGDESIPLEKVRQSWEEPLEKIFPTRVNLPTDSTPRDDLFFAHRANQTNVPNQSNQTKTETSPARIVPGMAGVKATAFAKPRVFLPVFPGTNCEYDMANAFARAGALVDTMVIRNLSSPEIEESLERIAQKIAQAQIIAIPGGFSAGDEPDGSGRFIATVFRNPRIQEAVMTLLKHRDGLMLGICNGFQALIKLGLVPYGEIRPIDENCPTLTYNVIGRHISKFLYTKVVSNLSPWFNNIEPGTMALLPVSHGEGRFIANEEVLKTLFANGQVATQYVTPDGRPTYDMDYNPNGSMEAIEGITSPDGRVLGKMAHNERITDHVAKNIPGNKKQDIFAAGVNYFK